MEWECFSALFLIGYRISSSIYTVRGPEVDRTADSILNCDLVILKGYIKIRASVWKDF